MENFEKISRQETNENTALVLMLGVISEKLSSIIDLLKISKLPKAKLTPKDHME